MKTDVLRKVRNIEVRTRRLVEDLLSGAYHSAFKGQGMEFEDVREYLPGDEVRAIDWNVTARTGAPHIKTYREERELTVLLLVDLSSSGAPQALVGSTPHSGRSVYLCERHHWTYAASYRQRRGPLRGARPVEPAAMPSRFLQWHENCCCITHRRTCGPRPRPRYH